MPSGVGQPFPLKIGTAAGTACEGNDSRLSDARTPTSHTHVAADVTDLGTAAVENVTAFASAAQGALADSAVQPGDLAAVATTGAYSDLTGAPTVPADIGDLGDVVLTAPSTGQVLKFNGTNWVNDTDNTGGGGGGTTNDVMPTARVATTAALPACTYANGSSGVGATLTGNSNGALAAQDGVTLVANDLILVKDQSSGLQNGLYTVTQVGTGGTPFILTRHTSNDETGDFVNKIFPLGSEGTRLGRAWFICTNTSAPTIGTTAVTFDYIFGVTQGRSSAFDIRATDQGATAGNARGDFSVDLQSHRSSATQVASGAYSVVTGGTSNTSGGSQSVVCGGTSNSASGSQSIVIGGNSNVASSDQAVCAGGSSNAASGSYSITIGGTNNTASATYASTRGYLAKADKYGQSALAAGGFAGAGSSQMSQMVARGTTTDGTITEIFLDGSAQRITIPTDTSWSYLIQVIARRTDADGETNTYLRFGAIDNNAGTTALAGAVSSLATIEDQAAWDVTIDADDTNDALRIRVTGAASKTIRWVALITLVEVTG